MKSLQSAATDAEASCDIPDVIFRDYDIRGLAGTELTTDLANRLGRALGTLLRRNDEDKIYIGRDARLSSPELASALQAVLVCCGLHVVDLGEITTPHSILPPTLAIMPTTALWSQPVIIPLSTMALK